MQWIAVVKTTGIGAGWSKETRNIAISDKLPSVAHTAELFDGVDEIDEMYWINNRKQKVLMCELSEWWHPQAVSNMLNTCF